MAQAFIYIGLFLRLLNATWNGFVGPSFGADSDAIGYFIKATEYSFNLEFNEFVMGELYAYALGVLFYLITPSVFLGSILSCFAWLISALILKRTFEILEIKNQSGAMMVYALLPSSIMFTSVTLRESFQLLFVNVAIYSILLIVVKSQLRYFLSLILSVIGMGILHGALLAFGFCLFFAFIGSYNHLRNKKTSALAVSINVLIVAAGFILLLLVMDSISYQLDDGLGESIRAYQTGAIGMDGRANYKTSISEESWGLIFTIPYTLFQYLFEPMPWRVASPVDFIVLGENMVKGYLIFLSLRVFRSQSSRFAQLHRFLFLAWIVMSLIWSFGTVNWGTASRHHIPALGLLLLSAYSFVNLNAKKKAKLSINNV